MRSELLAGDRRIVNGGGINTLFGARGSPYVRILAAALTAMGADYETSELKPWDNPDYAYSLSSLGKIPICEDGDTLIDTIHIVGRFNERYGLRELSPRLSE
ncbi:glutathione S-transferase N-terminal domain-containing protein [Cedecea colo]|uniref:glutathione S-transferase N-terminal domain-containing protein n=1 Tax=Cedecea colo TaxID=2552946 RepID=UPI003B834CCC